MCQSNLFQGESLRWAQLQIKMIWAHLQNIAKFK